MMTTATFKMRTNGTNGKGKGMKLRKLGKKVSRLQLRWRQKMIPIMCFRFSRKQSTNMVPISRLTTSKDKKILSGPLNESQDFIINDSPSFSVRKKQSNVPSYWTAFMSSMDVHRRKMELNACQACCVQGRTRSL